MRDIEFVCPKCGTSLVIDASGAGTNVNCPKCSCQVIVPDIAPAAPSRRRGGRALLLLGMVALCCSGAAYWFLSHGRDTSGDTADESSAESVALGAEVADPSREGSAPLTQPPERESGPAQAAAAADDRGPSPEAIAVSNGPDRAAALVPRRVATPGAPLRFPLQYSDRGYLATRVELVEPGLTFRKEPAFGRNEKIVRRALKVGPGPQDWLGLAVNVTKRTLYLDLNRNLDLTDDPKGVYRSSSSAPRFRNVRFCLSSGGTNRYYTLDPLDLVGQYRGYGVLRSVYAGRITLGGQNWAFQVQDNFDGQFDARARFSITPNVAAPQAGATAYPPMPTPVSKTLFVGGHQYELSFAYGAAGSAPLTMMLKEVTSPMAELALAGSSVRWLALQGDACLAFLDAPTGKLALPADNYRLQGVCVQPASGMKPLVSTSGTARVALEAGTSQPFKVGPPLVSSVAVSETRGYLYLRFVLKGGAGEEVPRPVTWTVASLPGLPFTPRIG